MASAEPSRKLGAGYPVTLDALTPFTVEWFRDHAARPDSILAVPAHPLFSRARRTTTVNAQGNYEFRNVARGVYIFRSVVLWEIPLVGTTRMWPQGGFVTATVRVGEDTLAVLLHR